MAVVRKVWFVVLFILSALLTHGTELLYGRNYHIRNPQNNLCLTSQANTYRSDVGVFLGQVTLETCELQSAQQKWGVIQWSKENGDSQFWLYPKENGLNEVTAVLDPNDRYPVNNLFEIGKINIHRGRSSDERFVFHSLELNRCITSQGQGNPIAYDHCDLRSKDQQWKLDASPEEPPATTISDRSFITLSMEFTNFVLNKYFGAKKDEDQAISSQP